jgi:hypothetical protein
MKLMQWISYAAAAFAVLAAVLWFLSAWVKTPDRFSVQVVMGGALGGGALGGGPLGGGTAHPTTSPDLTHLALALKKQSKLSAWAASCAGVSAALGGIALACGPN